MTMMQSPEYDDHDYQRRRRRGRVQCRGNNDRRRDRNLFLLPPLLSLSSYLSYVAFSYVAIISATTNTTDTTNTHYYCGTTWEDASTSCDMPCPTGDDIECAIDGGGGGVGVMVEGRTCHGYTGCTAMSSPSSSSSSSFAASSSSYPSTSPSHTPPSSSPIIRPMHVCVSSNGGITSLDASSMMSSMSSSTQTSYGIIFDVQTTSNSPAIEITSLDFYTPLRNGVVGYDLRINGGGTWRGLIYGDDVIGGINGDPGTKFVSISSGNVTTSSWSGNGRVGELTRLSSFVPIRVDGGGSRIALYLTLHTRELLYSRDDDVDESSTTSPTTEGDENDDDDDETDGPDADVAVLASTPELVLYAGAAVMAYPDPDGGGGLSILRPTDYRMPRGFVGRIWYHRNPCAMVPGEGVGVVDASDDDDDDDEEEGTTTSTASENAMLVPVIEWEDCAVRNDEDENGGGVGSGTIPDVNDKDLRPFFVVDWSSSSSSSSSSGGEDQQERPNGGGGAVVDPESTGTSSNGGAMGVTMSPAPSSTNAPSTIEDGMMKAYMIITLRGNPASPDRILDDERGEVDALTSVIMGFYAGMESLEVNEVELHGCGIFYQQILPRGEDGGVESNVRSLQRRGDEGGAEDETEIEGSAATGKLNAEGGIAEYDPVPPPGNAEPKERQSAMAANAPPADTSVADATDSIDSTTTMVAGLSLEVTLVIYILYSPLPLLITQELLQTLILDSKAQLISSLRNETTLSSYFRNLDSIPSVLLVDNVTDAPTISPTLSPTLYVPTLAPTRGPSIVSTWQLGVLVYVFLALFTMAYIKRARTRMEMERHCNSFFEEEFDGLVRMEAYERIAPENDGEKAKKRRSERGSILGRASVMFRGSIVTSQILSDDDGEDDDEMLRSPGKIEGVGSPLSLTTKTGGSNGVAPIASVKGEDDGSDDGKDNGRDDGEALQEPGSTRTSGLLGRASKLGGSIVGSMILNKMNKANRNPIGSFVSFIEEDEKEEAEDSGESCYSEAGDEYDKDEE